MYTLCAHCKTLFRVNAQQLAAAQGQVRCGICHASFNALDNLAEQPDDLLSKFQSITGTVDFVAEDTTPPALFPLDVGAALPVPLSPGASAASNQGEHPASCDNSANEFDLINASPIITDERSDPATLIPEPKKRISLSATVAWSAVNLTLIFILAIQFIYFNRRDLAQYAEWRPTLEEICRYAGCEIPHQRDITKITLINRELRSHPAVVNALLVTATLVNNAPFRQPYPMLQLSLSDFSGRTVAIRRFQPAEYMSRVVGIESGMLPGMPVGVSLELADPGKAAVGFEFSFI